ncbi:a-type inclusion protein [Anaeramoeba flamelloides]|uniref:A-type inclusion protein n=1 Tax=Anaeramoeba flamelloides TaxID=1746091 RepID=A0ABQ8YUB9_9EUKA|nr:a-type inclusion protein [Anaeramoeba flamelloides]
MSVSQDEIDQMIISNLNTTEDYFEDFFDFDLSQEKVVLGGIDFDLFEREKRPIEHSDRVDDQIFIEVSHPHQANNNDPQGKKQEEEEEEEEEEKEEEKEQEQKKKRILIRYKKKKYNKTTGNNKYGPKYLIIRNKPKNKLKKQPKKKKKKLNQREIEERERLVNLPEEQQKQLSRKERNLLKKEKNRRSSKLSRLKKNQRFEEIEKENQLLRETLKNYQKNLSDLTKQCQKQNNVVNKLQSTIINLPQNEKLISELGKINFLKDQENKQEKFNYLQSVSNYLSKGLQLIKIPTINLKNNGECIQSGNQDPLNKDNQNNHVIMFTFFVFLLCLGLGFSYFIFPSNNAFRMKGIQSYVNENPVAKRAAVNDQNEIEKSDDNYWPNEQLAQAKSKDWYQIQLGSRFSKTKPTKERKIDTNTDTNTKTETKAETESEASAKAKTRKGAGAGTVNKQSVTNSLLDEKISKKDSKMYHVGNNGNPIRDFFFKKSVIEDTSEQYDDQTDSFYNQGHQFGNVQSLDNIQEQHEEELEQEKLVKIKKDIKELVQMQQKIEKEIGKNGTEDEVVLEIDLVKELIEIIEDMIQNEQQKLESESESEFESEYEDEECKGGGLNEICILY